MTAPVDLTNPIFTDLDAARKHFEAIRWPNGARCPFCGKSETVKALGGKSMGPGWYHCKECRKKFTAAVGTIYERSHIPMTKWLLATHLMCASKKGMSAHQLHRMLGLPYKTAWFMAHRIREGMRELNPTNLSAAKAKRSSLTKPLSAGRRRISTPVSGTKKILVAKGKRLSLPLLSAAAKSARTTSQTSPAKRFVRLWISR